MRKTRRLSIRRNGGAGDVDRSVGDGRRGAGEEAHVADEAYRGRT